ncbi:polysaccharide pyruvyl transferase [Gemmatirosa kalamazoonensis]|uniref:Polysaccharide pyruvyl transferase n=1 Tax=Gemmatirosa kalamazoonensis TaxID=861299 RepID=W0RBD1_9BACT|nr:polysaccharide pyruvyl transferase [Gemmatirosa kalamazoonensis]
MATIDAVSRPVQPQRAVEALRDTVLATVGPLLGSAPHALVDFPNYPNVGDSAIYLGQLACLRALGVGAPAYVCDLATYDRAALARRVGGGTILLAGGGNFGDLWPSVQAVREDVIRSFPANRVVQLPQTIHFRDPAALRRARDVVRAHPALTLLVRDAPSLEIARRELGADARLCPDMAFCLGSLRRPRAPDHDVVRLARTDAEAATAPNDAGVPTVDWMDEPETALRRLNWRLTAAVRKRRPGAAMLARTTYGPLARQRLRRGLRMLAAGRAVITDRLHGHILALLLGIPHVLLDDAHGKLAGFHAAWTHDVVGVRHATSLAEAVAAARDLARDG